MKVFPVAGGRVRDPRTRAVIPADGYEVADNDFYWLRRIAHGDVTTEAPATAGEEAPADQAAQPSAAEDAAPTEGSETVPVPATIAEETHQ